MRNNSGAELVWVHNLVIFGTMPQSCGMWKGNTNGIKINFDSSLPLSLSTFTCSIADQNTPKMSQVFVMLGLFLLCHSITCK